MEIFKEIKKLPIFKKLMQNKEKILLIVLILSIFIAGFFRLYRIREYMTFLGDEGRDMLVVKRMLIDHKFTLLGPITSVGSIYMGPAYYYMIAPFLLLWNFDPVGPSIMVAILGIATVFLIFLLGKEFISRGVGLTAAILYAVSPLPIIYSRSSWNPNVVPFFSVLIFYLLLRAFKYKKYDWMVIACFFLGILIQLHYVTFMFFLIIPALLILYKPKILFKHYLYCFFAFIVAYSPFILFEIRHSFVNTQGALRFILSNSDKGKSGPLIFSMWHTFTDVTVRLFWRLVVVINAEVAKLFILFVSYSFFLIVRSKEKIYDMKIIYSLLLWLFLGIISFAIYGGIIYDYYFGSLFVVPYILSAISINYFFKKSFYGKIFSSALFLSLVVFSLSASPLRIEPNNMMKNTKTIAEFVHEKTMGKPYNFALIAAKNSDHAYRYFLELWGNAPRVIENPANDPERKTVTEQLLIVCEEKECNPLGHPLWEIAGFGQAEIEARWRISTAEVLLLRHYNASNI